MLHNFKKIFAKTTAPSRGINPGAEYLDYKDRLATIKKNLIYINKTMDDALRNWGVLMIEQRSFSQRFSEGYPISGDETDEHAKDFYAGSQTVYDHFLRNTSPETASYHRMHAQLKLFIKEISEVESLYGPLVEAKSESERYQAKVDSIDRSKRNNELKKARNLQKMDQEKLRLVEMTNQVVNAQKVTYAKAPVVYKAALCAYWSAHEKHTQVLMESMEKTSAFVRDSEVELAALDVSQLSPSVDVDTNIDTDSLPATGHAMGLSESVGLTESDMSMPQTPLPTVGDDTAVLSTGRDNDAVTVVPKVDAAPFQTGSPGVEQETNIQQSLLA